MDLKMKCNAPSLYGDPTYDSSSDSDLDTSSSSCSSTSSSSTSTSSSSSFADSSLAMKTSYSAPAFQVTLPRLVAVFCQKTDQLIPRLTSSEKNTNPEFKVTITRPPPAPNSSNPRFRVTIPQLPPTLKTKPKIQVTIPVPTSASTPGPEIQMTTPPPIFTVLTLNTWLLATWTLPPNPRYLRNINLSRLRDAPLYIWNLPTGIRIRESIKGARGEFVNSLYIATDSTQTRSAADTFIKKIDTWILELRQYARTFPGVNGRSRKAAELMIKHRAVNLTYKDALSKFGEDPRMDTLVGVRAALKELYVLKHISDV
jgi:hypothetical protein